MSSRKPQSHSPNAAGKQPVPPAIAQDDTYVPPALARFYLTHLTATLIHYQGFTSCQAEVIAELEKKVEDHIANIFGTARLLAESCGRRDPQSVDVVSALEVVRSESLPTPYPHDGDVFGSSTKKEATVDPESQESERKSGTSRSRHERRARRREFLLSEDYIRFIQRDNRHRAMLPDGTSSSGIPSLPLVTDYSPATTAEPSMLTISDSEDMPHQTTLAGPSVASKLKVGKKKRKLGYMLDVAPSLPDLPPRHTWKRSLSEPPGEKNPIHPSSTPGQQNASRLSTSALTYLTSTLNTSSNIPPELSLVNHRLSGTPLPVASPYSDAEVLGNERVPGPLVQLDYTSAAMQGKLDMRLSSSGYASDSRLAGSSRSKKHGARGLDGDDQRARKFKFVVPGLHKRQPNPKVPAL